MNKKKTIIAIILLAVDQLLKSIMQVGNYHVWLSKSFAFNYHQNYGAAWSILDGRQYFLIFITLILLGFMFNLMYSFEENRLSDFAFGLLFGGILGNLVDRVFFGFVRDFIDIKLFSYNYPIFNIADMAIVIGVFLIILETVRGEIQKWKLK